MNLDIKKLELKLKNMEPSMEYFGGKLVSDPNLAFKEIKSMFATRERNAMNYVADMDKYINKATIKKGVQDCIANKELIEKLSNLLDIFPEFNSNTVKLKDTDMEKIINTYKIDSDSMASKIGLTILLSLWFVIPFIGFPALVPLIAIWSDKKEDINMDDLNEAIEILIGLLITSYNKAFNKNIRYDGRNDNILKTIKNDFNKLLGDKDLLNMSKGKTQFKLDTSEKLLYLNAARSSMSLFKAFVGNKPSKNMDIARKLAKSLNTASIDELGEEFMYRVTWVIDVIGLLDKLQDIMYDCIINLSKDVFKIMA